MLEVKVKRLHPDAIMPHYVHRGDAGMDVYSTEDVMLERGAIKLVPTGLSITCVTVTSLVLLLISRKLTLPLGTLSVSSPITLVLLRQKENERKHTTTFGFAFSFASLVDRYCCIAM